MATNHILKQLLHEKRHDENTMGNFVTTSSQSIYKNALPVYANRLDLQMVNVNNDQFVNELFCAILDDNAMLPIDTADAEARKLRHLYFETRNLERTKGEKTLKIGFPLFLHAGNEKLVVAPLFLFPIQLETSPNHINSWLIQGNKQHIEVNNWLLDYWKEELGVEDLGNKMREWALRGELNMGKLQEMQEVMEKHLGFLQIGDSQQIIPAPGIDVIGAIPEGGAIQWSSVLGIFPAQQNNFEATDIDNAIVFKNEAIPVNEATHPFGLLDLDPHQETAFQTARQQRVSVIDGQQGSGKTHTLTQLCTNILSNGERCLIVSDSILALKKTQQQLSRLNLDRYNFLLKDAAAEKELWLEILRAAADSTDQPIKFSTTDFKLKIEQIKRGYEQLNEQYQAVKTPIFGEFNWTELVGLFLQSNRKEGRELLNTQLNANDFDLNFEEYQQLKVGILSSNTLFQKVNTLKHPLTNLHPRLFNQYTKKEASLHLKALPVALLEKTNALHYKYMSTTDTYKSKLRDHYDRHYRNLSYRVRQLQEKISDYSTQYGDAFHESSLGGLRFLSIFSASKRALLHARREVAVDYLGLVQAFEEKRYFDYTFQPTNEGKNVLLVKENLETFSAVLMPWRKQLDDLLADDLQRLTHKSALSALSYAEPLLELETDLEALIQNINEAKLYAAPLQNKMLTIPRRQQLLEQIKEQLESTRRDLRDLPDFFPWHRNWLNLSPLAQKVIKALVKVQPNDWITAFESWYFHQYLTKHFSEHLLTDEASITTYEQHYRFLQELLPTQIDYIRQERQKKTLKELKSQERTVYDRLFTRKKIAETSAMSLADLYNSGRDAISEITPILLTTPSIAQQLSANQQAYYDYVIFIETNQFLPEDVQQIALAGKRIVIISDPSLDNEFSLSEYAKEQHASTTTLQNTYSKGKLAELLLSNKDGEEKPHLEVMQVEGRFKDKEGINDVEAQYILRILNKIKRSPQRTYPSVGIVTFTPEQRDLVATYLLKLKQSNSQGAEKIKHLERNGMGVFHIEEMYGQDFDVLIVSLTFGIVNLKGHLGRRVHFLQTPEGNKAIKLLINKTLRKTFLINSIPSVHLQKFLTQPEQEGPWLLANLINYAESLQGTDASAIQNYRQIIYKPAENANTNSVFIQEVEQKLNAYFEPNQMRSNQTVEAFDLPLSISLEEGQPILIQPDLFFATTPYSSFIWEATRRHKMRDAGITFQPILSTQWWKNPHQSARRLASSLLKKQAPTTYEEATTEEVVE